MSYKVKMASCLAVIALAGCSGGGSNLAASPTASGIGTVSGTSIDVNLSDEGNRSISTTVGRVAIATGIDQGAGQVQGFAGIAPGASVGAEVTNGNATYNSNYIYTVVDNVVRTDSTVSGDRVDVSGNITLNADFDGGTLTGNDPGTILNGNTGLSVNATIDGSNLGGTATANYSAFSIRSGNFSGSATGAVTGQIGADGVIGVFEGNDPNTVVVGGFIGS